jgi:YD repeat-containing protein
MLENKQGANSVSSYAYTYDRNGNRTKQVESNGGTPETTTYGYDDADWLTSATYPDKSVAYTYDGPGNRATEVTTSPLANKSFTYDSRNRLTGVADSVTTRFAQNQDGQRERFSPGLEPPDRDGSRNGSEARPEPFNRREICLFASRDSGSLAIDAAMGKPLKLLAA